MEKKLAFNRLPKNQGSAAACAILKQNRPQIATSVQNFSVKKLL